MLRGVLVRMVKDQSRANDLLQDAFLRIWANLYRYNSQQGRLFTWLRTITRNVALDELNRRRRHHKLNEYIRRQVVRKACMSAPEMNIDPSLFETITPKYRPVIECTCQGYTQEEVARQLGLPLGTVKTRYRTDLQKLKLLFNQDIYYYTNYPQHQRHLPKVRPYTTN